MIRDNMRTNSNKDPTPYLDALLAKVLIDKVNINYNLC